MQNLNDFNKMTKHLRFSPVLNRPIFWATNRLFCDGNGLVKSVYLTGRQVHTVTPRDAVLVEPDLLRDTSGGRRVVSFACRTANRY